MRKKSLIICVTLPIIALMAMVLALLPSMSNRGLIPEDAELLKPGMTQSEVEKLLHGPPRNGLKYRSIIWLPQSTGKRISAEVVPVTPPFYFLSKEEKPNNGRQSGWITITLATDFFPQITAKNGHQGLWITGTGLIAVYFGQDGRLQHKYSSTVSESGPLTVVDWLASRPRMFRQSLGF
jgi:hypothetical protein